ncbi:putative ISXO2-like transposase domain [Monocercomonoides exilis]|uniref:putative ISXO2-like transposase domain n=1 Tax=Monocercomonoides exilis TaxID=2049356 RepID=UPI00355AB94A|nr:putative ISXO2-like transposase domain [Monocercomonoides exilis]|eukprot:MONOS_7423.1-p1 / transcript=MONOS_7423.1 / gene=MONOS_7423 / organism=Monocercomonoides_exilis_PA203 / gene_product=unspecified product / transcript_product=unspecified product / location=Mono_scaffold00253:19280-20041(-) / protein_length=178 / sequence_SO=supercontig / SO=protein_coding / is_pseudo=false
MKLNFKQISYLVGISRDTVSYWASVSRTAAVNTVAKMDLILGGSECIVEIDEAVLRKRKFKKGRDKQQIWIFGMVERKTDRNQGKCLIVRVENRKKETLIPIIEKFVKKQTTVYSDEWRAMIHDFVPTKEYENQKEQIRDFVDENTETDSDITLTAEESSDEDIGAGDGGDASEYTEN